MLNLLHLYKDYHETTRSFSELVPWMSMINSDTVVNIDGSLVVFYTFKGIDAEGILRQDSDRYANLLEHALKVCDERMILWSSVDRRKIKDFPDGDFQSYVGGEVNNVWKQQFTDGSQLQNYHFMAFVFAPSSGAERFFEAVSANLRSQNQGLMKAFFSTVKTFFSKREAIIEKFKQLDSQFEIFSNKLREFEETVSELGFKRLANEDLLVYLHDRCSPASANQPVQMPPVPTYLSTYLPDCTLHREHDYLLFRHNQEKYVGAFSVKTWPKVASPGIVDVLLTAPAELTVTQIFKFVNPITANLKIANIEQHHRASATGIIAAAFEAITQKPSDRIDTGKLVLADDAQAAMVELTVENRTYGYYNMTVLGYGDTHEDLEKNMQMISTGLRQRGFVLKRETLHLLSAFSSTMPGQSKSTFRWSFMNIANVADLAFLRTINVGSRVNKHLTEQMNHRERNGQRKKQPALTVFQTEFSTPYFFNFHHSEDGQNGDLGHTLIVGPAGTGKSSLVNFLISQFEKYHNCNRIIFDKDYSCWIATLIQGGRHIDMAPESGAVVKMNPFLLLQDSRGVTTDKNLIWLSSFLKALLTVRGEPLQGEDDSEILFALKQLQRGDKRFWNFSGFANQIQTTSLKKRFENWYGEGIFAKYFDNQEDDFTLSKFIAIEMGGLLASEVAGPFMEYAFFKIAEMLTGDPTIIYIEECWFMLKNQAFADKINDWLKTLRKKNALVIMATQSLQEITSSEIFSSIIDNMQNKIYLPNPNARANESLYVQKMGLNLAQVDRIMNATSKLQYYITTPRMSRMVNAKFPPSVMACMGADELSKKIFRKHYNDGKGVSGWEFNYVKERLAVKDAA